jgi:WD40 repeat protein
MATRRQITALRDSAFTGTVTSVAFSADGTTLRAASPYHTVRVWDLTPPTCTCVAPINNTITTSPATSVALSPDAVTLATGNADGTVRLWDVATAGQITALAGPGGAVNSVAFSPDGTTLATGSADHTIRLWHVAYLVNVAGHLCASARRPLTRAEWARYVPGLSYQRICP